MKKRYLILASLLAFTVFAAGCGKDKEEPKVEITVTPTPQAVKENELVDMQKSTNDVDAITNVIGTKTPTASRFVLVNKTGDDIASINIRPHTEDEDASWGDDLVNGKFVLKNNDKAVYYFDKNAKDEDGKTVTSYDIRIFYTDPDRYECYFRNLPFAKITQLTLRMSGTGEDALPFVTYLGEGSTKEYSTLDEVKRRVGMMSSQSEESEDEGDQEENSNSENTGTLSPTPTPEENSSNGSGDTPNSDGENGSGSDVQDPIALAESYIGQSIEALKGACGEPSGSDYQNEPETGETGYYYYTIGNSTFTVSTTVDENGNEIVAGVW